MATKLKVTIGSGNVFRDIGFPEGEAENLLLRSELMSQVREVARGYTQQEAAKMLGITHPAAPESIAKGQDFVIQS